MPVDRVILALSAVAVVASAGWVGYNRIAYGSWAPPPSRVDYCSRRYLPAGHVNLAQIRASLAKDEGSGPFQQVGVDGWGEPYFARVYDDATKRRFGTNLCTFDVFVLVGSDDYVQYKLSGGP